MENIGDDVAAKFINALAKSVQSLCHGYLDFQNGIEIIGHINLSVDKGMSLDYILKEKVCKNAENSTLFISNSFHAEPKPEQDVPSKNCRSESPVNHNHSRSADTTKCTDVQSASQSGKEAHSGPRERSYEASFPGQPSKTKRKTSQNDSPNHLPAKVPTPHSERIPFSHKSVTSTELCIPVDSKEAVRAFISSVNMSGRAALQTCDAASIMDRVSDAYKQVDELVLKPDVPQYKADHHSRDKDNTEGLDVTFIKQEYVEEERSDNSSGQQSASGHFPEAGGGTCLPVFPVAFYSSSQVDTGYAVGSHDLGSAGQQYSADNSSPSTSQPQLGPSTITEPLWRQLGPAVRQASYHGLGGQTSAGDHYRPSHHPSLSLTWSLRHCDRTKMLGGPRNTARRKMCAGAGKSSKAFICDFCDAVFASSSGLRSHKNRVHLNTLPYWCSICGKGFTKPDNYQGHMNMHNNILAFKCPHCSKRYPYKTSLNTHLRAGRCQSNREKLHLARV